MKTFMKVFIPIFGTISVQLSNHELCINFTEGLRSDIRHNFRTFLGYSSFTKYIVQSKRAVILFFSRRVPIVAAYLVL
jgi:hypothetical protein